MNLAIWKRLFNTRYGLVLGLCILLLGALMAASSPLLPIVISDKVGLDKGQVMIFYLLNTVFSVVVTLGTGYVSDGTIARHKLVIVGGIIATFGYFGLAIATRPIHAFASSIAIVGLAVLFPQLFAVVKAAVVADWDRKAQVMGITAMRTLYSLGFVIGTALASILAQVMNIQSVFFLITAGTIGITIFGAIVLQRMEQFIAHEAVRLVNIPNPSALPLHRKTIPLYALVMPVIALFVIRGADSTRGVYLSLVMFNLFHNASIAPLMFGITAAAELVTMGIMGYLSSRIGEKATIIIGTLVGALYFGILSVSQSLSTLYAANALYAFYTAGMAGVAMAYIQGLLAHRAGMGGSLYMAVQNLGTLIGIFSPLLVSGYNQTIFVIPIILCVIGAVLLAFGDRTAQIEKQMMAANPELITKPQSGS
jgi:SET family sugar efflux transporter-like MFS transporter